MKKILSGALALVLFAGVAQAQSTGDSARHHKGGHEMMKNLNLTADQKAKFKAMHEQEHQEMQSLKTQSLTGDQLQTKRKELHQKYREQMQSILTPAQRQQMDKNKADWKSKGDKKGKNGQAFHGKNDFTKQLNLSQEQQDKLAQIRSNSRSQFESIRNDKSLSQDQKKEKMQSLRKEQQEQMKTILTQEQIQKMQSLRKERKPETK